jgi:hypothetical protein
MQKGERTKENKPGTEETNKLLAGNRADIRARHADFLQEPARYLLTQYPVQGLSKPKQRIWHLVCCFWAIIVAREYLRNRQFAGGK